MMWNFFPHKRREKLLNSLGKITRYLSWPIFFSGCLIFATTANAQEEDLIPLLRSFLGAEALQEEVILDQILAQAPNYETLRKLLPQAENHSPQASQVYHYSFPVTWAKDSYEAEYYVWVPPSYNPSQSYPLLLEIHGTYSSGKQVIEERIPFLQAQKSPYFLVCPSAKDSKVGWTCSEEERKIQLVALQKTIQTYSINCNQIYLMGVSRGGHGTWELGLYYTDYFAALHPVVGGPRIPALRFLENLNTIPMKDIQGALDDPILVENLRYAAKTLQRLKAPFQYIEEANQGHAVRWVYHEALQFFSDKQRNAHPKEITLTLDNLSHGERFWLKVLKLHSKATLPKKVTIPDFQKKNEAERRIAYIQAIQAHKGQIYAKIEEPNTLQMNSTYIEEIEIRLDPELLSPEQIIRVKRKGKELWKGKIAWDPKFCLREYKRLRDIHRLYWGKVKVKLPAK